MVTDRVVLLHLTFIEFIRDLISLSAGLSLKHGFQLFNHLIGTVMFKTFLEISIQRCKDGTRNYNMVIFACLKDVMFCFWSIACKWVTSAASSTYCFLHLVRIILRLRCQSVKFEPDDFSFSFSRNALKLN